MISVCRTRYFNGVAEFILFKMPTRRDLDSYSCVRGRLDLNYSDGEKTLTEKMAKQT